MDPSWELSKNPRRSWRSQNPVVQFVMAPSVSTSTSHRRAGLGVDIHIHDVHCHMQTHSTTLMGTSELDTLVIVSCCQHVVSCSSGIFYNCFWKSLKVRAFCTCSSCLVLYPFGIVLSFIALKVVNATTSQPGDGQELDDEFMVVWEGYPATCQLNLVNVAARVLHMA